MKNKHGFTLIEVVVVMAIIGILVTIVVTVLNPAKILKQTRDTRRKQDIARIAEVIDIYYVANGYYPVEAAIDSSIGYNSPGGCTHDGAPDVPPNRGKLH